MSSYTRIDVGAPHEWIDETEAAQAATTNPVAGRRFVDREIDAEFFGLSFNSRAPGTGANFWHAHTELEELYFFVSGEGVMALGDDIVPVRAGTAVKVAQGTQRSWFCTHDSPAPLTWICIRAGGAALADIARDAWPERDRPLPWSDGEPPLKATSASADASAGYEVVEAGAMAEWFEPYGGLSEKTSAPGRQVLDREIDLEFIGMTVNSRKPGEGAHYWHSHAVLDELYLFLDGEGVLALDDELIPVRAGTAIRVPQGVRRSWACTPESPTALKWVCIRAGGQPLAEIKDATMYPEIPLPW